MKTTIILIMVAAYQTTLAQTPTRLYPDAKMTLKVLNEAGLPVESADAGVGFTVDSKTHVGSEEVAVHGITNKEGEFVASAKTDRRVGFTVKKAGWYPSFGTYRFKEINEGRWEPWNPIVVVILKPIINPEPMYARKLRIEMPVADAPVGFDLLESDWVAPHGRGKVADFVFSLSRRFETWKDYYAEVKLAFSNDGDGIQTIPVPGESASELKLPRLAPEQGYLPEFATSIGRAPSTLGRDDGKAGRSYFFRVRTVLDEKREIASALYGKIDGDIRVDAINSKTALLVFDYYLNPQSMSRNMEFDPKRNLFGELKGAEKVSNP
jgi:hypothetical protein